MLYFYIIMILFKSDMEVMKELGRWFKQTRANLQLTQQEISEKTGVDRGVISRFENGESISLLNFLALMRAINKLEKLVEMVGEVRVDPRVVRTKEVKRVRKKKRASSKNFFEE